MMTIEGIGPNRSRKGSDGNKKGEYHLFRPEIFTAAQYVRLSSSANNGIMDDGEYAKVGNNGGGGGISAIGGHWLFRPPSPRLTRPIRWVRRKGRWIPCFGPCFLCFAVAFLWLLGYLLLATREGFFQEHRINFLRFLGHDYAFREIVPLDCENVPIRNATRLKKDQPRIAVVVVVERGEQLHAQYGLAYRTLRCYCQLQGYPLHIIDFSSPNASLYRRRCPQKDLMFRRHCAVVELLRRHSPSSSSGDKRDDERIDWALFLDADMGVVNPGHWLERRLAKAIHAGLSSNLEGKISEGEMTVDLIFYQRVFSAEVMAGSYFVRNSQFSRDFLTQWANYEHRLPPAAFSGSDNAAIHAVFLDHFCGNCSVAKRRVCDRIWMESKDWPDVLRFTACAQLILGERTVFDYLPQQRAPLAASMLNLSNTPGRILFLRDPSAAWTRDGWLTENLWASSDFFFHGWQKSRLGKTSVFAGWQSPIVLDGLDDEEEEEPTCEDAAKVWRYKDSFMRSTEYIAGRMETVRALARRDQLDLFQQIDVENPLKEAVEFL